MFHFHKIFEWLFKTFHIAEDTKFVERLEKEGVDSVMIVKHYWVKGVMDSLLLGVILILYFINITLLFHNFGTTLLTYILVGTLSFTTMYFLYASFLYIRSYKNLFDTNKYTQSIYDILIQLKNNDIIFARFFNQAMFNFIFLIVFAVIVVGITSYYVYQKFMTETVDAAVAKHIILGLFDVAIYLFTLFIIKIFINKMINLEMDYNIVVPGKIYFFNQIGMNQMGASLDTAKITSISYKYPNFLASFFQYGDIIIASEGDEKRSQIVMKYVYNPSKLSPEIDATLNGKNIHKSYDYYIKKLCYKLHIPYSPGIEQNPTIRAKMKQYIIHHEQVFKHEYEQKNDEIGRKALKQIYAFLLG